MTNAKKSTKLKSYLIIAAIITALVAVTLFILFSFAHDKSPGNGGLYPRDGLYKVTATENIRCTLSQPPQCSGSLMLSDEEPTRLETQVDSSTVVRYRSKEIQIYPTDLKEGMIGQVTFRPNSATIETMVIAD